MFLEEGYAFDQDVCRQKKVDGRPKCYRGQ